MKRKLSVGLVLALILTLITVGAVAAVLLGGKDFVDQVMAPMAKENMESNRYTEQELDEILKIAQENGIELPSHIIAQLNASDDGEYKEELMRQFVKTEYGFYPSAWPLDVQHWYEATMEACGQGDGHIASVLPEGEDEISMEKAIEIAVNHIRETYDPEADVENTALYRRHMTYTESIVNPYLTTREWFFDYESLDPYHNIYYVTMTSAGEIKNSRQVTGAYSSSEEMEGATITNRFAWAYDNGYGSTMWTNEILQEYQKALQYRVDQEGEGGVTEREMHALKQTYLTPDSTMLSKEAAIANALKACDGYEIYPGYEDFSLAICLDTEEGPAWKVKLTLKQTENRFFRAYVEMDAYTGAIKACDTSFDSSPEWREFVSESYWEQHKPAPAEKALSENLAGKPTPRPDGKPGLWYSDVAPQWYWEKLDAVGYNGDTASKLINEWQHTYGEDSLFWPLEAQAIDYIWHDIYSANATVFPGLPAETDISQELAIKFAKAAFEKQYGEQLGETSIDLEEAIYGVSYWFNTPYEGVNTWAITLKTREGGLIGKVSVNAQTGETEELSCAWENGFILVNPPTPAPTPTPQPGGKPWYWGDGDLPAAYWTRLEEAMAAHGVTFENIDQKAAEWGQAYDQDMAGAGVEFFWPQEQKAIYYALRHYDVTSDTHMILPEENGITYAQAEEIAWKAFREACKGQVEEEWVNSLGISLCLWSNDQEDGGSRWVVQFSELGGVFNTKGWVYLDGETGEVLLAELDMFGNG